MKAPAHPSLLDRLLGRHATPHPYAAPSPDAYVASDLTRCVQCGVCGYNCPVGILVRDYARRGRPVDDPHCVQCGQCIEACPRGTLRWARPAGADDGREAERQALRRKLFGEATADALAAQGEDKPKIGERR